MEDTRTILGVRFSHGAPTALVNRALRGGLVVVPSAPVLVELAGNPSLRRAVTEADLALADSGLMVLLWRLSRGEHLERVSGLAYLQALLTRPELRRRGAVFWVMPSSESAARNLAWLAAQGFAVTAEDCYVAPWYGGGDISDPQLVARLAERRPDHVIIALGGGVQERLGHALKCQLNYRPGIHCIGAAIGFLSGDQVRIPVWADRLYLGWLVRCCASPTRFVPRYWRALRLVTLMIRYRDHLPA